MQDLKYIIVGIFSIACSISHGQDLSNQRSSWIHMQSDTVLLDSLSLVPKSLQIFAPDSSRLDSSLYAIDEYRSELIWNEMIPWDSVLVEYRVLPMDLDAEFFNKDRELILPEKTEKLDLDYYQPDFSDDGIGFSELNKTGSISRGIAFGNTQDLSVNSSLNLQLSGKITPKINVLASVTDDNLPIQPQGNTQQLQDFDQVFIQLYDDNSKLIAGDFQLKARPFHFLKYYKRAQGGTFQTRFDSKTGFRKYELEASAAVSKGKFARKLVQGVEGNQGPYRLTGAENETFIVILAGTERVYIDGRLLKRGLEFDYMIDYNTAEITFTSRQLITKDRRIAVEFQYSDKNYARSLIQAYGKMNTEKSELYFGIYTEGDSKNQPIQEDITELGRETLTNAGDDLLSAVIPSIDSVAYSNDLVLYELRDSLGYDSVFVQSNDPNKAFYQLSFSVVGSGNGDYVQDEFSAVGRVFKWIAPDTINSVIVRNGDHSPVNLLVSPKKSQMIVVGGKTDLGRDFKIKWEAALSNTDLNTFSNLDSDDNVGFAGTLNLEKEIPLGKRTDSLLSLVAGMNYEYLQEDFRQIERFRAVEFERNWNVLNRDLGSDQHLGGFSLGLNHKRKGKVLAGYETFLAGSPYSGNKAILKSDIKTKKHQIFIDGSYLNIDGSERSDFMRHRGELGYNLYKSLRVVYKDEHEYNRFFINDSDSLLKSSYRFYDWKTRLEIGDSSRVKGSAFYGGRTDWRTGGLGVSRAAVADEFGGQVDFKIGSSQSGTFILSNRRLRITNDSLISAEPENTVVGRVEHRLKAGRGWLTTDVFYELGAGLEQRREFIYLQVPEGQGTYVWNDYNGDGVKDLNEFEVAQFAYEADYIRTFIPSDDYARTYSNQFSFASRLNPSSIKGIKAEGFQGFIRKFSNQFSYKVSRKTASDDDQDRFNPFFRALADTNLLSQSGTIRNTVFFNRIDPKYGLDYTFQRVQNKSLLTSGFDSRFNEFNSVRVRWNPLREMTIEIDSENGRKNSGSDFLENRNYRITYTSVQPKLTWQPNNSFRLSVTSRIEDKNNEEDLGGEEANVRDFGGELRYNVPGKGSFQASLNYIDIEYTGSTTDNSLSFEMLEGLRPGNNYTWSASLQKTLANNLQLSLLYNGRSSEASDTIHSGGAQLRAFF